MSFDLQTPWFNGISRRAGRLAISSLLLTACSCSSVNRQVADASKDPFLEEHAVRGPAMAARAPQPNSGRPPVMPGMVRQAGFEDAAGALPAEGAIQRANAEPRLPAVFACPVVDESPTALAKIYPDEYLFDGGDRESPIHYEQTQMAGLDTEDAAIEYTDGEGQRRVRPTNRVAVYSPRFAAVTSVSQPIEGVGGGRPVQAVARTSQEGLENRSVTFSHHQRDMAERMLTRSRGSGLQTTAAPNVVDAPLPPQGHVHTAVIMSDFGFVQTGQFKQSDEPRLASSIDSALVWTRDQNPVILAKSDRASELRAKFKPEEMVGQENRFNGRERLRIVKLADKRIARSGEVVTFTIRFDNIGDRPANDVVIIDNLTPRLEYVEDSAECNLEGRLIVEDNGEGSLILRWELDEPLAGRTGGVVSFKALVR